MGAIDNVFGMNDGKVAGKNDDNIDHILSRYHEGT